MTDRNLGNNSKNGNAKDRLHVVYCTFEDMKQLVQKESEKDRPIWIIRHPKDGGNITWEAPPHCACYVLDLENDQDCAVAVEITTAAAVPPSMLVITTDVDRDVSVLQPSGNEEYLIQKVLRDDVLAERVKVYSPGKDATDDCDCKSTREGIGHDPKNLGTPGILQSFSRGIPAHLPHVCHAPPYEGHTLAFNVAKEGKRVIIFSPPQLQPKQYGRWASEAIVVDADIESEAGFDVAAEALRGHFDLIVFICDPTRLSDEMIFTDCEEMLLDVHMWFVLGSRERVFRLRPEETSDNVVLLNPLAIEFDQPSEQPWN
ncbi:hypothetical protein SFHH103_03926 [Sinorhizobium fredii HH103]|uniref:Uncharacterized protein n=1 Tax=Sinorhizobium fredii (strain HH103) TaxID=1117943 RepID=G9A6A7_SINF1|nr:hypothetical protein [Sinorhizobium fredii]CCE98417.1 hypothetical protein SFHH103_03926 [Sinorhizobium fredii HH103]